MSPLGKIPAYRDGDFTLADSSVIRAYIERRHPEPALYPADPCDYARALWFEEYGDTALYAVIAGKIFTPKVLAPMLFNQKPDETAIQKAFIKSDSGFSTNLARSAPQHNRTHLLPIARQD